MPPLFLPAGVIRNKDLTKVERLDPSQITENVTHSWYEYAGRRPGRAAPVPGRDEAEVHRARSRRTIGWTPPAKYTWLKSPRYDGLPMEVGPLSRMLVAYASGHPAREGTGRARADEARASAPRRSSPRSAASRRAPSRRSSSPRSRASGSTSSPPTWARHDLRIHDNSKWDPCTGRPRRRAPASTRRRAARSATGCASRTARSPTTSASCRARGTPGRATRSGQRGPYEEALLDTPVADAAKPVEILRTIHSFDPCLACGVHVLDGAQARDRASEAAMIGDKALAETVRVYVWEWPVRVVPLAHRGLDRGPLGDRPLHRQPVARHHRRGDAALADGPGEADSLLDGHRVRPRRSPAACGGCSSATTTHAGTSSSPRGRSAGWASARRSATTCSGFGSRRASSGHNPLAGMTYTFVFVIYFIMIGTGLAIYSVSAHAGSPLRWFQFLVPDLRRAVDGALAAPRVHVDADRLCACTTSTARC